MTNVPNDPYDSSGSPQQTDPYSSDPYQTDSTQSAYFGTSAEGDVAGTDASVYGESSGVDYAAGGTDYTATGDSSSTKDTATEEARHVKDTAADAASQVAGTAKEQAQQLTDEVKTQAASLMGETRTQLADQVGSQRDRAVGGLRSLAEELGSMADAQEDSSGVATRLAQEGSQLTHKAADYIERHEPSEIVDELRNIARRRPGVFLAGATIAGAAVGRLTRGAVSARSSDDDSSGSTYPSGGADYSADYSTGVDFATTDTTYAPGYSAGYTGTQSDVLGQDYQAQDAAYGQQAAPLLDEPYGEQTPPAGYSRGTGGGA